MSSKYKLEGGGAHSAAKCPGPYDKIIAIVNKTRVRNHEEKNKIFNMC